MEAAGQKVKKKFNRKAYLKQKFKTNYGSQQAGHGQAFLQKKVVVRQYYRQKNKEETKERKKLQYLQKVNEGNAALEQQSADNEPTEEDSELSKPTRKNRLNNWRRAKAKYKSKIAEKQQIKEAAVKKREEIEAAKKRYKEKRLHRFKKLSQKTRKGQPRMSGRIELMLETLQAANS